MKMLTKETAAKAKTLLGLIDSVDARPANPHTCRQAMALIQTALKDLVPALWPHEPSVEVPVPDKVLFLMREDFVAEFNYRSTGIYFGLEGQEGTRLDVKTLTADSVQKLVLDQLTTFYGQVAET